MPPDPAGPGRDPSESLFRMTQLSLRPLLRAGALVASLLTLSVSALAAGENNPGSFNTSGFGDNQDAQRTNVNNGAASGLGDTSSRGVVVRNDGTSSGPS